MKLLTLAAVAAAAVVAAATSVEASGEPMVPISLAKKKTRAPTAPTTPRPTLPVTQSPTFGLNLYWTPFCIKTNVASWTTCSRRD